MGIFKALKDSWKAKTTVEKIGTIIDIITMIGSGAIGGSLGKTLSAGQKPIGRLCTQITCSGLGIAAGNAANKALKTYYGEPLGHIIDTIANPKKEEEPANG